jgi:hypothetical protein
MFLYGRHPVKPDNSLRVTSEERIRELCAQLFRAEHPLVIEGVAAQLQEAINAYVSNRQSSRSIVELITLPAEKAA